MQPEDVNSLPTLAGIFEMSVDELIQVKASGQKAAGNKAAEICLAIAQFPEKER